jgi:peptidoglycan/xylan/chitin deacetylase (PgdA/CDA1 family)
VAAPASAAARRAQIRRRRLLVLVSIVLAVLIVAAGALALRPDEPAPPTSYASQSAVDRATQDAAASAQEAAKAAREIEERTWSIGPYAEQVPKEDGVSAGAPVKGLVALTFDDGPGRYTYDVLALLKRYKMKATFFVLGSKAEQDPAALRQMVEEGHVVAAHSWTHASMVTLDAKGLRREFDRTNAVIREATGRVAAIQRPPFGDFDARTNRWSRANGMLPILWNVDSNDWQLDDPRSVVENVLGAPNFGPGAIILLHDGGDDRSITVNALPAIMDGLRERGLRSVTIPELLRQGPPETISPGTFAPSTYAEGHTAAAG